MKGSFERLRPCNALDQVQLLVGCSSSFSLPSSHAANFGAAAFHLSWFYPRFAPLLIVLALLVGYSRVYVGVHYPFDVLLGLAVGLLATLAVQGLYRLGGAGTRGPGARFGIAVLAHGGNLPDIVARVKRSCRMRPFARGGDGYLNEPTGLRVDAIVSMREAPFIQVWSHIGT